MKLKIRKLLFNSALNLIRAHLILEARCARIRHLLIAFKWYFLTSMKIKNPVNTEIYGVLL